MIHQGLLEFLLAVLSMALGGMIGNQVFHLCGWRFDGKLLRRFSKHQDRIERAQKLIQCHPYPSVIGTYFMYGFRVTGLTLIDAGQLPPKIFLPLNILGAFTWALIFATTGYAGGQVIVPWLHNLDQHLKHWVWLILVMILVVGARRWLKRDGKKKPDHQAQNYCPGQGARATFDIRCIMPDTTLARLFWSNPMK